MISILNFDPCNFHVFFKQLLFTDSLKRCLITPVCLEYAAQYFGCLSDFFFLETTQFAEVLVPIRVSVLVYFNTQVDRRGRQS